MDEMSKNMSFEYPEKPKFREQETGHVYFDIEKTDGVLKPYTYTIADSTAEGYLDTSAPESKIYKVSEFKTKEELIGWTETYAGVDTTLSDENIASFVSELIEQGYDGEFAYAVVSQYGMPRITSFDASFIVGHSSIPEPGLYICDGVTLNGFKEADDESSPFSKNVKLEAHTEYTSHANGKIGGDDSVLVSLIDRTITEFKSNSITSVGYGAFYGCSALTTVDLPNATSIGDNAFNNCSALTTTNLPNATSIGNYAFGGLPALAIVNLPNATSIGNYAFSGISPRAVINLGAAEGEIPGAPWGASNSVTINYNVRPAQEG